MYHRLYRLTYPGLETRKFCRRMVVAPEVMSVACYINFWEMDTTTTASATTRSSMAQSTESAMPTSVACSNGKLYS